MPRKITLKELKERLKINQKDLENISRDKEFLTLPNTWISIGSDYAFECQCCKDVMPRAKMYKLLKQTTGPGLFGTRTSASQIITTKGIFRLSELAEEPEFSSTLNYVKKEDYVCDHCMDSVYTERV